MLSSINNYRITNILIIITATVQQITTSTARSQIPPALIIVDSVQTLRSSTSSGAMGSVSQIRDSTAQFVQLAKLTGTYMHIHIFIYIYVLYVVSMYWMYDMINDYIILCTRYYI